MKTSQPFFDGHRPIHYKILTINLANARTDEKYEIPGYNIAVLSVTAGSTVTMKLNTVRADAIDLTLIKRIESCFNRFFITNSAKASATLVLAIGTENFKVIPA